MTFGLEANGERIVCDQPAAITSPLVPFQPFTVSEGNTVVYGQVYKPLDDKPDIEIKIDPAKL